MRAAALTAALVLASSPALAGDARTALEQASSAWSDLEYEQVIEATQQVLQDARATREQRLDALRLLGSALIVVDKTAEAERAFEQLFALDPEYELPPNTSPRIRSVFQPARARWQVAEQERLATELGPSLAALRMRVDLPAHPQGGRPILIGVDLVDPQAIADRLVLAHRRRGTSYYTTTTIAAKAGASRLAIPGELTASEAPYTLELYVQARHRSGVTLRREGEVDRPLQLAVAAGSVPTPTPIYKRWWFWTGIAVVAVGTAFLVREAVPAGEQRVVFFP